MARLNIDDQFWLDILGVAVAVGNTDLAIGNAIRFFRFAQEKHKQGKNITAEEFKEHGFYEALIPLFANYVEAKPSEPKQIQAKGYKKYFLWLNQKIEAGRLGGKKSAATRKKKLRTAQPAKSILPEAKPSGPEPSSSPSSSPSYSNYPSSKKADSAKSAEIAPIDSLQENPTQQFIKTYCEAYKAKYLVNPVVTGRNAAIAKRIVVSVGLARSLELVDTYLTMNDHWYVTKRHDLGTLEQNIDAVNIYNTTGKTITRQELKHLDQNETAKNMIKRIRDGSL